MRPPEEVRERIVRAWVESARDDLAWADMGADAENLRGVAQIGFGNRTIEVGEVAGNRARKIGIGAATLADVVENGAAFVGVDAAHHDAALAGAQPRPDRRRRGGVDRASDGFQIEVEGGRGRGGRRLPRRAGDGLLVTRGAGEQIAE